MTSAIHFGAHSWKAKLVRDDFFLGETDWHFTDSGWLSASGSSTNDTNTTTTWTHEARDVSELSHHLKDFGVTVNDTTSLDVLIDVESHWKYNMYISAYDELTEVRDWVTVSLEV